MSLTKADMASILFLEIFKDKEQAKNIVEAFFGEACSVLIKGEELKLSGFGNFQLRDKRQRIGRNPKTGVETPVSARRVVVFQAGHKLKEQIAKQHVTIEPKTKPKKKIAKP